MIFEGQAIRVSLEDAGIAHLIFDLQNSSVNKFSALVLNELKSALEQIRNYDGVAGLLCSSAKPAFIVGADITEFEPLFRQGKEAIHANLRDNNAIFNELEDLSVPTVVAINGYALGGGMEFCLACDYRIAAPDAKIGLPETKLGIIPGWGGTVRLPRLAGLDVAVEWIASGKEHDAETALKAGVVDGVVESAKLLASAKNVLLRLIAGKLDYKNRKAQKQSPLKHNDIESLLAFESSKAFIKAQAGRNYPAPVAAIQVMQDSAKLSRDDASAKETESFVELSLGDVASSLVGIFLNDQYIGKQAKKWESESKTKVERAAVIGAGIMGGGIAYQSAYKGVPIVMKDIAQVGIDLGLSEASKLLTKRVERGRMTTAKMAEVLNRIDPALSYDGFKEIDIVVEAVVENPKVKHAVLTEVEQQVTEDAILCSNTSTISITHLAEPLKRPENFCGMHFFNPVHAMPLVEVIRGEKTSDQAIARTVAYANALGKKAIVVNDCPGFLVNRVLFPYFAGFSRLIKDGADFQQVDKVMERWGWPMGPAYLMDVVGIDTGVHAEQVMAQGFPERMSKTFKAPTDVLFEANRYGQKNNAGFYNYQPDKKGKPQKVVTDESYELLKPHVAETKEFTDDEIIYRMMLPMATELARCLEENIVSSAQEADMALVYGLGFPPFRGGLFRWIDRIGTNAFVEMAKPFEELGPLYVVTDGMRERASKNESYYAGGQS